MASLQPGPEWERLGLEAGEKPDLVYLLKTGLVRVGRLSPDGRELTLAELGPGEILGELAFFDGGSRTAGATAVTETTLAFLSRESFEIAIAAHPEAALNLIFFLCRRLRRMNQLARDLSFLGVKERLCILLLRLGEGEHGHTALTHQELADMIGASRESVTRALSELRREAGRRPNDAR